MLSLLAALCVGVGLTLADEPVRVEARFEPAEVVVGDHLDLVFEVEVADGYDVAFPEITPEFADGYLELLGEREVETVKAKSGGVGLRKRYRLIAFEEGDFRIDSVGVLYAREGVVDSAFVAAPLELLVQTIPADTTLESIHDIKGPMDTPVMLEEFGGYVLYSLFGLAVLASLIYMFTRLRRKAREEKIELPKEPAHVIAIRELEDLHNRKLWQNHKYKEYYTRLSDILREYLSGRYGVSAMEMTSDEIIEALKELALSDKQRGDVTELLRESDLVKFAKHIPDEDLPESSYYKVYYFVEESKEVEGEFAVIDSEGVTNDLDIE